MQIIFAEPLDAAAFAPFGEVLAFDCSNARTVNDGFAQRSDLAARFDSAGFESAPKVAIFRARHQALPASIGFVERHPHSTQAFMPLAPAGFLVVVTSEAPDGGPDLANARAFLGREGQGVNYRRGLWHAPITAIEADSDFLMLSWERNLPDDTIVQRLASPFLIRPPEETSNGA